MRNPMLAPYRLARRVPRTLVLMRLSRLSAAIAFLALGVTTLHAQTHDLSAYNGAPCAPGSERSGVLNSPGIDGVSCGRAAANVLGGTTITTSVLAQGPEDGFTQVFGISSARMYHALQVFGAPSGSYLGFNFNAEVFLALSSDKVPANAADVDNYVSAFADVTLPTAEAMFYSGINQETNGSFTPFGSGFPIPTDNSFLPWQIDIGSFTQSQTFSFGVGTTLQAYVTGDGVTSGAAVYLDLRDISLYSAQGALLGTATTDGNGENYLINVTTPEPATLVLTGTGLILLIGTNNNRVSRRTKAG